MVEIYSSNLYKSTNPSPFRISVYIAPLKSNVQEHIVRRRLTELFHRTTNVAYNAVVTHGKLYSVSLNIIEELSEFVIKNKLERVTITNDNEEHSKVIGGLLYRSLDLFFYERGFITMASKIEKGKRIFYKNDPLFIREVRKREATFKAIRGLRPKIYAGSVPDLVYIFLTPEGTHVVEVSNWRAFLNQQVKIKKKHLKELASRGINYSRIFKLVDIKTDQALVRDLYYGKSFEVSLDEIYIPATTKLLNKFNVLQNLQAFTSFRETQEMTEYRFLDKALNEALSNAEAFTLKVGLTDVTFRRIYFEEGESDGA